MQNQIAKAISKSANVCAITLGMVMIAGSLAQGQTYVFRTVDMLGAEEYPGAVSTFALTINDSGTIVGGYTDATRTHGFILQNGSYTTLDFPGSAGSYANAINKVGQIVGEYSLTGPSVRSGIHGYLMTGSNSLTPIDFPRDQDTEAQGLNNNGQIVGDCLDSGLVEHGFSFNGTTYSTIDFPGSSLTTAFDINDHGQIVGTSLSQDYKYNSHGYLATPIPGTEQRSEHTGTRR